MIKTNLLKKGLIINIGNKNYVVLDVNFLKPGKGGAYYRTKLKEIPANKVVEKNFKSGEMINAPEVEKKNLSFLYNHHKSFFFLDEETYEQKEFHPELIDENIRRFLKEGEILILTLIDNKPVFFEFKKTKISYKVLVAPPAIKGDSVSNSFRSVVLETGADVMVPLFIKEGEQVIINIETGEYSSRGKET